MLDTPARPGKPIGLLLTAYVAFIGLGLPDAVTGVAWPSIRESFSVEQSGLGLILACAALGYLVSSVLAGSLTRALSLGGLLALSSGLVTLALVGYATAGLWPVLLLCAAALGAGGGAIDAALNLFVATAFGARQMNWLHAFYGVGAALGPLLMTGVLASGLSWRAGIAVIAAVLAGLTLLYVVTRRAWSAGGAENGASAPPMAARDALRVPAVRLQLAAFFVLTGLEATAGQWSFTVMTEARGVDLAAAGLWVGGFWALFTLGRIAAGFLVVRVGSVQLARLCALGVAASSPLFALGALGAPPVLGGLGLWALGFCIGPLFPGLMAETPRRLGPSAAGRAVGLQIGAAIVGMAALPALAGLFAGGFGLEAVSVVLIAAGLLFLLLHERLIASTDRAERPVRAVPHPAPPAGTA